MILRTILGITFAFVMTLLGSSLVFFFKKDINSKLKTVFYGLSAGIMLAATIWSLIIPSINNSEHLGNLSFLPAVIGILVGAGFIAILDLIVKPKANGGFENNKNLKLFLAVTIHNIPEGLAVGFAFGVALQVQSMALCMSALSLAVGMGLQNFPEGAAISLPLKSGFKNRGKAFLYGFYSAIVEPIASILGVFLAMQLSSILSYILSFAAGAMLYVIIEELLPEANLNGYNKLGTWCFIIGFLIMMVLDVVFA